MEIKLIDNPVKLAEFLNNPANTGNIVDSGDKYYIKPDAVYLGIYEGLVLAGVHEVRNFWHSVVECHAVYDPGFRGEYALQLSVCLALPVLVTLMMLIPAMESL